ncbi:glycerophosphodiester phosphodiesterase [Alteromonas ponticola]|uniref:glycerophosphodiester phosphodiesterase n=1 Tax=Alteromonas aquimaris TaxID=2998417 RepID=A0ABT3P4M2_9ALTE|nr:glycerophosphodiester phosphodiesterase [Alteromonas aquimaris]MCW8107736.1 glycerophosphodiester phosphodiesterase [Alteromonas aquimaris]
MLSRFTTLLVLLFLSKQVFAFDIIAHRGASGYLPEHTLAATTLAHAQLPAYIEQDVVLTKDSIPVVLHDIHLDTVTDVAEKFPEKVREDGRYYVIDFTLAEIKTLQVHERTNHVGKQVFPQRYQGTQAQFTIATLAEHLELIAQLNRLTASSIGVYPEIKAPAWHRKQGKDISAITLDVLAAFGYPNKNNHIILQCFDFKEITRIREELGYKGKLVQLIGSNNTHLLNSARSLKELANVVDGIGPSFNQLLDKVALSKGRISPQTWVTQAQNAGLLIHPYTLRADQLPPGMTLQEAVSALYLLKVDGVFTDHVPPVKTAIKLR